MPRTSTNDIRQEYAMIQAENERLKECNELLTMELGVLKNNLYYRLNEKNKVTIDEIIFHIVTGQIDNAKQAK